MDTTAMPEVHAHAILTVRARRAWGPTVTGYVLLSRDAFSPRADLDRSSGVVVRRGHSLQGEGIAQRVLACSAASGGVAGGWAFYEMRTRGVSPAAMLFNVANPVMVQGAVVAGIAIMDGFECNLLDALCTGDRVIVDPKIRAVTVVERRCHEAGPG